MSVGVFDDECVDSDLSVFYVPTCVCVCVFCVPVCDCVSGPTDIFIFDVRPCFTEGSAWPRRRHLLERVCYQVSANTTQPIIRPILLHIPT